MKRYVHLVPRLSCLLAALAAASPAHAQPAGGRDAASQPVRIVIPFLGGGVADGVARIVAARLPDHSKTPYQVENRPGDEGHFGAEVVSKAEPDGRTLLFAPITVYAAAIPLPGRLHYDLAADFSPVTLIANAPHVLVVHPSLPAKSVKDVIALAKANPGRLRWASHGNTSLSMLELDMFRTLSGIKVASVPYNNITALLPALISGNAELAFDSIAPVLPHVQARKLRVIAVAAPQRSPALREVPTVAESGVAGFEANYWYGLLAPAGTSTTVVDRLAADFAKAVNAPDTRERLLLHGIEARSSTAAEIAAILASEIARWRKVVTNANAARL